MIRDTAFPALLTRADAVKRCRVERLASGIVVFTNGVFDILHRGHLDYLQQARALGHLLIVGLNSDESVRRIKGPKRPLVSQDDRAFALCALRFVDHVVLFDEDTPQSLIEDLSPSILVKGGDYQPQDIVGSDHVIKQGGKVVTIPLIEGRSTSSIIDTIVERYR
jgi:D-beta-D-heptose 7-phosphate kinase/D-beta-D-heptose 1-phosphate adenosyltransferase